MTHKHTQSGFSLVETLVAITILLLVIIGPLSISSSSVRSNAFASEQAVAFFLAQEGAELVQQARDYQFLEHFRDTDSDPAVFTSANPNPWADFKADGRLSSCYTAANGCGLSLDQNGALAYRSCDSQSCLLHLNASTGQVRSRYTYDSTGNTPTIFTRKVQLSAVGTNEVRVVSTVTWRSGFSRDEQQVQVETSLFNVYDTN